MTLEPLVMVGASGFGREALDVVNAMRHAGSHVRVIGVVDDQPSEQSLERLHLRGIEYLGTSDEWLSGPNSTRYVLGIGSPRVRRRLVERFQRTGRAAFTAIHPSATYGSLISVGEGSVICAGATISTNVTLGMHVHINPAVTIGHDSILEDFVSVNPGAVVSGEVRVQSQALIGAGAIVLQNLVVGVGTIVGAAALLTKDAPAGVTVKGVPGRWDIDNG
ncbi:acetyltransferase [Tessaracoccus terricola]